jgi:hypothetical protein
METGRANAVIDRARAEYDASTRHGPLALTSRCGRDALAVLRIPQSLAKVLWSAENDRLASEASSGRKLIDHLDQPRVTRAFDQDDAAELL